MQSVEGSDSEHKSTLALPHTHTWCKLNVSHPASLEFVVRCVSSEREGGGGEHITPLQSSVPAA